uniref:Uncharacterized protein n=2 Tax=Aceria tosichella TaxID=561515 RepID=A0A6G1S6T9_9ACAR
MPSSQHKKSASISSSRSANYVTPPSSQSIHMQQQQQHQCLADQFLSMIAKGSHGGSNSDISIKDEHISTARSSFVSSDSELLNNNNNNINNHHHHNNNSSTSNKFRKFKQILQSIPVVPLVATTSIMTIILLCLLLIDSLHLATAGESGGEAGGYDERLPGGGGDDTPIGHEEQRHRQQNQWQADFMLDGEPHASSMVYNHRPAHLRSSALELDLSPEIASPLLQQRNLNKQPARVTRPSPTRQQQQQQHMSKHPHRQIESPTMMLMGRSQSQQQQQLLQQQQLPQQQSQSASESTMEPNNNHERKFDVPQIQCNNTDEGFERFACPTPDELGRYRCIEDRLFCDGYNDCPHGEDEERVSCMYYRLFVSHIDILTNTFLTWMKSQNRQAAHNINSNQHHHKQPSHLFGELDA